MRLVGFIALGLLFGCASTPKDADTFSESGVVSGSDMSQSACKWPDTSVWVVVGDKGECIRYFQAGMERQNEIVHVFFHGDRLVHNPQNGTAWVPKGWYNNNSPNTLQGYADREFQTFKIPYVRFSRPGVYGSSGDHKRRRLIREVDIVQAGLEALKKRYGIRRFALSGQSGGGHIVASILPRRTDIICAVITSGAVAVRERVQIKGWLTDATGLNNYFDPIDHVHQIPRIDERRIFIVGDPRDTNVPFSTQVSYYDELKESGHGVWLIKAKGRGSSYHGLSPVGFRVVKRCVDGEPASQIVKEFNLPDLSS